MYDFTEYSWNKSINESSSNIFISKLSGDDIKELISRCMNNECTLIRIVPRCEEILLFFEELLVIITNYDFYSMNDTGNYVKMDSDDRLLDYMYDKFGEEYVENYFEHEFNIPMYRHKAEESAKELSSMLIECGSAISEYCDRRFKEITRYVQ